MIRALEAFANIPVSTTALASLFPENKAGGEKVRSLEQKEYVIRLKRGLYVVNPEVSRVPLSLELIANHLYAPSYVSMSSALRYYGLIPETVYTVQSMTVKHSRSFDTPVGHFDYSSINREAFHVGVTIIDKQTYTFLMASPEKALCDLIANSPKVNLRYIKDVERYLEEDIRLDMDVFLKMDASVFEQYIEVGKKASSIQTLLKYLRK
jgi:predicted transcriptional regulator of viral defense system